MRVLRNVADEAAEILGDLIRAGTARGGRFSVALSGGRTPWEVFAELATIEAIAWPRVSIYQVDERLAPIDSPERNLTHLQAALTSKVPAVPHPLPVDDDDPEAAAQRYADSMPRELDLVHLGLGADGHTASLVPGDPILEMSATDVAVSSSYEGHRRMTLTLGPLNRARQIVWIVTGTDKRTALRQLLEGDPAIPAAAVSRDNALVLTDLDPAEQGGP